MIGRRLESYMCTEESKLHGYDVKSCSCSEIKKNSYDHTIDTIPKSNQ